MASSPPRALSPPGPHLSLPIKRPSAQHHTNQPSHKRRKPSTTSVSSAHPLRQTSFPPPDGSDPRAYSPDTQNSQVAYSPESLDIDDDYTSVLSARTSNAAPNKRGQKRKPGRVGRPPKTATRDTTASLVDGDTASSRNKRAGTSAHPGADPNDAPDDEDDDDDGGDDGAGTGAEGAQMEGGVRLTRAAVEQDKAVKATFQLTLDKMDPAAAAQFGMFQSVHLNKNTVRRLTNQTLSQSVPQGVVNAIAAYTKLFAGDIIDRARQVQKEWTAAAEKLPTGDKNEEAFGKDGEGEPRVKERDRGPLLPDHLREALRRYKMSREGGVVGFTGLSLEGKETVAARNGGKRLFR